MAGGLKMLFHITPSLHLRIEGYGFAPIKEELKNDDNSVFQNKNTFENYYLQGMAAMVYQTGVGPVSFAVNYYDKENTNLYLTLNFGYILFNKRGF
jgi:NTE family protein